MKNQPLKPWIKGNESITPNNFFSNALPNLEYGAWISLDIAVELYKANTIDTGYLKKSWNELLMLTSDGNVKTLLPVSELPCILSLIQ